MDHLTTYLSFVFRGGLPQPWSEGRVGARARTAGQAKVLRDGEEEGGLGLDRQARPALGAIPLPADRLKVLISAYSCYPGRGSEPGIGWNTAREMAKLHEVWVITRTGDIKQPSQRAAIEAELAERPIPSLHFIYYDLPAWTRRLLGVQVSSYLWQIAAFRAAREAHRQHHFDLAHHVSWVRYYTPSFLAWLPIPYIWGPIGGGDAMPKRFRKHLGWRAWIFEVQRRLLGAFSSFDPLVRLTARNATLVLANSRESADRVAALGASRIEVFGESGVDDWVLDLGENAAATSPTQPVRFATLTRLMHWKGVHLGIEAFARSGPANAIYWVIGDGPEQYRLEALARKLGISDRVVFFGALTRAEWMDRLNRCDALVHPCIYNSGSAISLEAMAMKRPVICLDRGGIRNQVSDDVGFRVLARDPDEAIAGMTDAMKRIIQDREVAAAKGQLARERVRRHFSWAARGAEIDRFYTAALSAASDQRAQPPRAEGRKSLP